MVFWFSSEIEFGCLNIIMTSSFSNVRTMCHDCFWSYFSQGVNAMDNREVSTKIPLSEVPFVMRAMGFYPSEQEVVLRLCGCFTMVLSFLYKKKGFVFIDTMYYFFL